MDNDAIDKFKVQEICTAALENSQCLTKKEMEFVEGEYRRCERYNDPRFTDKQIKWLLSIEKNVLKDNQPLTVEHWETIDKAFANIGLITEKDFEFVKKYAEGVRVYARMTPKQRAWLYKIASKITDKTTGSSNNG